MKKYLKAFLVMSFMMCLFTAHSEHLAHFSQIDVTHQEIPQIETSLVTIVNDIEGVQTFGNRNDSNPSWPPRNVLVRNRGEFALVTWDKPDVPPVGHQWFSYVGDNDQAGVIGVGQWVPMIAGKYHRYTQAQIQAAGIAGGELEIVSFRLGGGSIQYSLVEVRVYTGGSVSPEIDAGELVYSRSLTSVTVTDWNDIVLTESIPIPSIGEIWFGVHVQVNWGLPLVVDSGPMLDLYGNIAYFNGWTTMNNMEGLSDDLEFNWMIRGMANIGDDVDWPVLIGYNLYRTLEADKDEPDSWEELALDLPVTGAFEAYSDLDWADFPIDSEHRYIVEAVFSFDDETYTSTTVLSNMIKVFPANYNFIGNLSSNTGSGSAPIAVGDRCGVAQTIYHENEIHYRGHLEVEYKDLEI